MKGAGERRGRGKDEGRMGDRAVSIDPQNTHPHVESIRNNLVFYPPLQKKGGFSESVCVCVYMYTQERERSSKGSESACFSVNLPKK